MAYDNLHMTFCQDKSRAHTAIPLPDPDLPLSNLLAGFFHYYSQEINLATSTVSIRLADFLDKTVRMTTSSTNSREVRT